MKLTVPLGMGRVKLPPRDDESGRKLDHSERAVVATNIEACSIAARCQQGDMIIDAAREPGEQGRFVAITRVCRGGAG